MTFSNNWALDFSLDWFDSFLFVILLKETEISNLSFLFYAFEEIFLSKKKEKESKDFILKKIIKFLIKFKSSNFIPIIFNEKYFNKFLLIKSQIKKNQINLMRNLMLNLLKEL